MKNSDNLEFQDEIFLRTMQNVHPPSSAALRHENARREKGLPPAFFDWFGNPVIFPSFTVLPENCFPADVSAVAVVLDEDGQIDLKKSVIVKKSGPSVKTP